jgi:thioredoxin 1
LGAAKKFRNFEEMLNQYHDKPVLVSFHSTLCGPCRLMKKELKAVRKEVGDTSLVFVVDTERWPSLGVRYHVRGLPTILIFKQGEILYQHEGVEKAEELVRRVKALI